MIQLLSRWGIESFSANLRLGLETKIILGCTWLYVDCVRSFTFFSNKRDTLPKYGSLRTAGNFSGLNNLGFLRLSSCDFITLLINYNG